MINEMWWFAISLAWLSLNESGQSVVLYLSSFASSSCRRIDKVVWTENQSYWRQRVLNFLLHGYCTFILQPTSATLQRCKSHSKLRLRTFFSVVGKSGWIMKAVHQILAKLGDENLPQSSAIFCNLLESSAIFCKLCRLILSLSWRVANFKLSFDSRSLKHASASCLSILDQINSF